MACKGERSRIHRNTWSDNGERHADLLSSSASVGICLSNCHRPGMLTKSQTNSIDGNGDAQLTISIQLSTCSRTEPGLIAVGGDSSCDSTNITTIRDGKVLGIWI